MHALGTNGERWGRLVFPGHGWAAGERCEAQGARVINASATGSEPEALGFDPGFVAGHETMALGVWVRSMGLYERACATLSVWHKGKLVATLPEADDGKDTLCPGARSLTQSQSFWQVGTLDLTTMVLDTSQSAILPGVPSL